MAKREVWIWVCDACGREERQEMDVPLPDWSIVTEQQVGNDRHEPVEVKPPMQICGSCAVEVRTLLYGQMDKVNPAPRTGNHPRLYIDDRGNR